MKNVTFKTRHALVLSCISLMTCFAMLLGTTFAWFTDSVTSGVNRIISGNLDVEITHQTAGGTAEPVSSTTKLFTKDMNGKDLLWEPEVMAYETFTVSNEGTLNLKYQMNVNKVGENNLNNHVLADVIRVAVVDGNTVTRDASLFANAPTLAAFVQNPVSLANFTNATGSINAGAAAQSFTIMLYWPEDGSTYALAGQNDNDYNVNNTSVASDSLKYLWVNLGITLVATQETGEYDSFTNTYDQSANTTDVEDKWAGVAVASAAPTLTATTDVNNVTTTTATTTVAAAPTTNTAKQTTVTLTAVSSDSHAAFDQNSKLNLKVETNDVKASSSSTAFTVTNGTAAVASIDLTLTKTTTANNVETTETLTSGFTSLIDTYVAAGLTNPNVVYSGTVDKKFGANNPGTKVDNQNDVHTVGEYWYNAADGHLVFMTDHYSQYYVTSDAVAYIAATDTAYATLPEAVAAVGSKGVITLLRDSSGAGIFVGASDHKDFTVDFAGYTYTCSGPAVGSTGTQNQAWHLEKGNTVTLRNGTVKEDSSAVKMLIQNYCNLTLTDMVLDFVGSGHDYALSNNCGTVVIGGNSKILVDKNKIAFDACVTNYYPDGTKITVKDGTVIAGNIEYGVWGTIPTENKVSLTIEDGTVNGMFVVNSSLSNDVASHISITGGTFDHDPTAYVAAGYVATPNATENPTSWTVLSATDALAAKAKAAGLTVVETGIEKEFSNEYYKTSWNKPGQSYVDAKAADGIVYRYYQDGKVYIQSAKEYTGTNLTVKDVDGICTEAFTYNTSIETVTIAADLEFGLKAFQNNSNLKSLSFSGVTKIPNRMFYKANGLTEVTLPSTVTTIEIGAFQQCANLTKLVLPEGLTEIPENLVCDSSNLTEINIPESVKVIGAHAIRGVKVSSLTIPAGVTSIGSMAFRDDYLLKTIYLNCTNVPTIASDALQWSNQQKWVIDSGYTGDVPSKTTIYVQNGTVYESIHSSTYGRNPAALLEYVNKNANAND